MQRRLSDIFFSSKQLSRTSNDTVILQKIRWLSTFELWSKGAGFTACWLKAATCSPAWHTRCFSPSQRSGTFSHDLLHTSNNSRPLFGPNGCVLGTFRQHCAVRPLLLCDPPSPLTTWSLNLTSISHRDPWAGQNTCGLWSLQNSQLFIFHMATATAKQSQSTAVIQAQLPSSSDQLCMDDGNLILCC